MDNVLNYLRQNIDNYATIEKWNAKPFLNLQLADSYDYYMVTLLEEKFLLLKALEAQTIQKTKLQMMRIQDKTNFDTALLLEAATPYRIKKMLEERMAFIATDKQMYLPFMALHIRKQTKLAKKAVKHEKFTAATQQIFLAILYSKEENFSVAEMAKTFDLSAMTVFRAMEKLMELGILSCEIGGQTGRKKIFKPIDKKEYYRIGRQCLINPVKNIIYVSSIPKECTLYKSGLTALGEQTMLGEPSQKVFAISHFPEELEKYQVSEEQASEECLPKIQVMKYDIGKLTANEYVDPVTLVLALDEMDDRIEIAIDELMEGMEWYEE